MTVSPTVLLVDDERMLLTQMSEFLASRGCRVLPAGSAECALKIFREAEPGAITVLLTDFRMDGMDGLALIDAVCTALPPQHAMECLILSGHLEMVSPGKRRDIPVFGKPIPVRALLDLVAKAHERALVRRRASETPRVEEG
jgi:DNA-binding NtrC family response regulator